MIEQAGGCCFDRHSRLGRNGIDCNRQLQLRSALPTYGQSRRSIGGVAPLWLVWLRAVSQVRDRQPIRQVVCEDKRAARAERERSVGGASTEVSTLRLSLRRNSPKVTGRHPAAILEENSNHLFASFKAREPAGFLPKNCYNHREFRWYPCRLKLSTAQKQGESCGILDIVYVL